MSKHDGNLQADPLRQSQLHLLKAIDQLHHALHLQDLRQQRLEVEIAELRQLLADRD
ncbi:MAG: hypothetical protein ABF310_09510 [Paracoccaceae bacterium]|jgi:hypothetical protein